MGVGVSDKPIRALIDILENVPNSWYGKRARLAQHSVLVAMAKYANADGKNVWASLATIAYAARVSTRTAQRAIDHFLETNRLKERPEPSSYGTKVYDLVLPTIEDAKDAKLERAGIVEKEREGARVRVARFRQKALGNGQSCVTEQADVTDTGALCNGQSGVSVTDSGALCNAQLAVDLSFDRPHYRPREREATIAASRQPIETSSQPSLSPSKDAADAVKRSIESAYEWLEMRMAEHHIPIVARTEKIIRTYLNEGYPKEIISTAISAVFKSIPDTERQPGLYLSQNLRAYFNLAIKELEMAETGDLLHFEEKMAAFQAQFLETDESSPL
jgi:hypothetical protein